MMAFGRVIRYKHLFLGFDSIDLDENPMLSKGDSRNVGVVIVLGVQVFG